MQRPIQPQTVFRAAGSSGSQAIVTAAVWTDLLVFKTLQFSKGIRDYVVGTGRLRIPVGYYRVSGRFSGTVGTATAIYIGIALDGNVIVQKRVSKDSDGGFYPEIASIVQIASPNVEISIQLYADGTATVQSVNAESVFEVERV